MKILKFPEVWEIFQKFMKLFWGTKNLSQVRRICQKFVEVLTRLWNFPEGCEGPDVHETRKK